MVMVMLLDGIFRRAGRRRIRLAHRLLDYQIRGHAESPPEEPMNIRVDQLDASATAELDVERWRALQVGSGARVVVVVREARVFEFAA